MTTYSVFSQTGGDVLQSDSTRYTLGMQFTLSAPANLTGIWFYSPPSAGSLPSACCIFAESSKTQVPGTVMGSPTWSGIAGSGWVKCTYTGFVTLAANTEYKVCVQGGGSNWYSGTNNYWSSGPGQFGLTSGIITAPNNTTADGGQDTFIANVSTLTYPANNFLAGNYWIDIEVATGVPALGHLQAAII